MSLSWSLAALIVLGIFEASSGYKCITCATPYLQDNWHLVGLPQKPQKFHADCNVASLIVVTTDMPTPSKNLDLVDCGAESFCFSYTFEVLDPNEATGVSKVIQAVRGCHKVLAGVDGVPMPTGRKCDQSSNSKKVSADKTVSVKSRIDFCNTEYCNNIVIADDANCNDASAVKKTCKQCSTTDSNCNDGTCTGRWCAKSELYVDDSSRRREVTKDCTTVNIFFKSQCTRTVSNALVQTRGVSVPVDITKCLCDGDNCNGAGLPGATLLLVAISAALVKLFV